MKKEKAKLPVFFKPILWSYDFAKMDAEKHKKTIITNTINYGNLKQWKWIANYYGKQILQKEFDKIPQSAIRPQALKLASILFSIKPSKYVSRSTK